MNEEDKVLKEIMEAIVNSDLTIGGAMIALNRAKGEVSRISDQAKERAKVRSIVEVDLVPRSLFISGLDAQNPEELKRMMLALQGDE